MNKSAWVAAHLAAFGMIFVGGWVTLAGFLLFTLMSSYAAPKRGDDE
jgi:hypothetical protein